MTAAATPTPDDSAAQEAFERTWPGYPRRVEKKAALKAWVATVRREGPGVITALETATANYARSVADKEPQFVKHAATFYGPNEPWRDHLVTPTPPMPPHLREARPTAAYVPDYLR